MPLRDLVPAVPETLARTLSRCLAKSPDERWQTANDLLFELRSLATATMDPAVTDRAATDAVVDRARRLGCGAGDRADPLRVRRTEPAQVAESRGTRSPL